MTIHKTIKTAEEETTDIICVLDRSTSIRTSGLTNKTIEGFNSFLADQKKAIGKAKLTLCLFDGGMSYGAIEGKTYEIIHDRVDIEKVPELNDKTFVPKGMTAMYDAIGTTIDAVYSQWQKSEEKPDKVVFLIMTDGEENSSKEYTQKSVFEAIQKRKDEDKWAFIFIGANIDTMKAGGGMGISKGNTMSYSGTERGVNTAYMNMSASVSNMRSTSFTGAAGTIGLAGTTGAHGVDLDNLIVNNGAEKENI
jgi:uncharacterized protein YegL